MSSHIKAELAVTCSTLGRFHKGEYLIEPECIESVKDLIRYLKRDSQSHEIRRYLGESKVLQSDLIHIIKSCDNSDLFDATLRLLINLTTPAILFYGEEIPEEKVERNIYLSLVGYSQDYKIVFCDVEFWNKICGKLTDLFEIDWTERSMDDGIQIERILMLLRNVLQVPADIESEKRPENDITVHDKVLWALRQSQILELLLFISSNVNEEQYYLNLLEIFSIILREQNPKVLAECDIQHLAAEKNKDAEELIKVRESEKMTRNKYINSRNFNTTFVMKGVKSLSNHDVVCHKSLEKVKEMDLNRINSKKRRLHGSSIPVESERVERRSTYSVRLFLKEFCLEFLSNSFQHLMNVVKNKLDSGKSLANDQTYYFWALKFFLDFATASNSNVDLIKNFLSSETFHFVQTSMDDAFDHLESEKKKTVDWIKRIHLILKAYRSLLETLLWMDHSKSALTRSISREVKSQIFYVVEYREMTLHLLLKYDSKKFSTSYLRDLIETTHLFVKLIEDYSKQTKLVVQKITKKKSSRKKRKNVEEKLETPEEKWEKIKDDVYDILCCETCFPEIPPFDAALDIPIDDQKGLAMKKIQKFLREENIRDGIGLLRSARQVWPENDYFGKEGMSVEDETMALQEICLADLGEIEGDIEKVVPPPEEIYEEENEEESDNESRVRIVEQEFDIMDYKNRYVNKKVVEGCGILLKNYKKNPDHTNHCAIKLLHRIGWECCMPAMLFQASLFWTLLKIMRDKTRNYKEINTFTENLMRKFRKHAEKNPTVFLELLFWKDAKVALEIQHGYEPYENKSKARLSGQEEENNDGVFPEIDDTEINEKNKKTESLQLENLSGDEDGGTTTRNLSRTLNENDFELDRSEISTALGRKSPESSSEHKEAKKDKKSRLNIRTDKTTETSLINDKKMKDKRKVNRNLNSKTTNIQKRKKTNTKSSRRRMRLDSSDEEKEDKSEKTQSGNLKNSELDTNYSSDDDSTKPQKTLREEKERDNRSYSQTSNTKSKKRSREVKKQQTKGISIDEEDISISKRIRHIESDSDEEDESESEDDEGPILAKNSRRKKKLLIIDSDSDLETNSFDKN